MGKTTLAKKLASVHTETVTSALPARSFQHSDSTSNDNLIFKRAVTVDSRECVVTVLDALGAGGGYPWQDEKGVDVFAIVYSVTSAKSFGRVMFFKDIVEELIRDSSYASSSSSVSSASSSSSFGSTTEHHQKQTIALLANQSKSLL